MAKFEFSQLTDKQKKIIKASGIALASVLVFLIIGALMMRTAPSETTTPPSSSTNTGLTIIQSIRNFIMPPTSSVTQENSTTSSQSPTTASLVGDVPPPAQAIVITDPRMQQQLVAADQTITQLNAQITALQQQLTQAQQTLHDYQATANATNTNDPLVTSTINGMQQQVDQYQAQIDWHVAQLLIAQLQIAYYFCQGVPVESHGSSISLDDLANGTISLVNDDGTFNGTLCENLAGWTAQLIPWIQNHELSLTEFMPVIRELTQGIFFYYCQGTHVLSHNNEINITDVMNGTVSLVNFYGEFEPLQCPVGTAGPAYQQNDPGYAILFDSQYQPVPIDAEQKVFYFPKPVWVTTFGQLSTWVNTITIDLYLYININIDPLEQLFGGDTATQIINRQGVDLYLDPLGSSWQDGILRVEGIIINGKNRIENLRLLLRYGAAPQSVSQVTSTMTPQQAEAFFATLQGVQTADIKLFAEGTIDSSQGPDNIVTDTGTWVPIMTLEPNSIVDFYVEVKDLNPDLNWVFDIIDATVTNPFPIIGGTGKSMAPKR